MTKIIIIRHCETVSNAKGEMQGYHQDSEFTENGRSQIERLISRLREEKIDVVFCSDLGRAYKTAEAIANHHGLNPIEKMELRECDIGDWKDLPVKEGIGKWIEFYEKMKGEGMPREEIRPPNGENSFDHQKRVMKIISKILSDYEGKTVVVVGHSGTNRVVIGSLQNMDPDDFYSVPQSNACINIIEYDSKGDIENITINDLSHLANDGTN